MGARDVKAYDVLGDTVNTAKRIEGAAAAGEILLSDAVAARVSPAVSGARSIEAKGKAVPLRVFAMPVPAGAS
jgi:class 3 adenylate cyclase